MLILKQTHYIAISFLAASCAAAYPVAVLSCTPQLAGYLVTKLSAKALKDSRLSTDVTPAIKAGLLTLYILSLFAGFMAFGAQLGSIYAISLAATFFINQKELDKGTEFNKFVHTMV